MLDIRQTSNYAKYLSLEGWIVERTEETNYFIKRLPLIGSILKVQRPEKIDFDTIDILCRKYGVFHVVIEPRDERQVLDIKVRDFRLSKNPYLPSKTIQIDLTQSQEKIFANFKKHTRQAVRKVYDSERPEGVEGGRGVTIKEYSTPNEIKIFRKAWKKSVNFNRYVPSLNSLLNLRKSFPQNKSLFLASHNISSRIIGGALFTRSLHDFAYYWYGFTNKEGRSSLSQHSLLWQGILWARKQGCKIFDLEGIYDSRFPNRSWLGFSHFKKSFGGVEVLSPGCYTKFRFPW